MGLLDSLFPPQGGSGLLGGLPSSWQYPTSAPDAAEAKKKQDADFLASISQDPSVGGFNPNPTMHASSPAFPGPISSGGASPLPGANSGQFGGSTPFGLGGMNLPQQPQGVPASGPFPAVPPPIFFAPQPAADPPQAAPEPTPQQDGPINSMDIGGYKMPQFGSAADYTPTTTPANAQPTQGTLPPAAGAPQDLPPALGGQQPGFFDRLNSGLQSIGHGGSLIGALTGNRTDPTSISQQNLRAQYQAIAQTLVKNGDTPQQAASKALLAVMNPKAAETILPEAFTNKEEFKTIKDGFGGEHPAFVNTRDQTINGKSIDAYNQSSGVTNGPQTYDAIAQARDAGATPAQLYQMAPASLRAGVQAMIEGRALPTNLSARGDARNQALMLAHTIDPTFDESQISGRVKGFNDFYAGGKSAETMRKTNQSALHFAELVTDKMPTLPGTPIPAVNAVTNLVNTQLLGKGSAGNFVVNAHALADELSTMFKGAGISDTEIKAWESNLSPNMSLEQQRGMSKTLLGLYRDGVIALEKKRQDSVGPVVAAQKGPILGPEAEAALNKVEHFANGGNPTGPGGKPPVVIQNGHTYNLQADGSYK